MGLPPIALVMLAPGKAACCWSMLTCRAPAMIWKGHLIAAVAVHLAVRLCPAGLSSCVSAALQVSDCGHAISTGEV